MDLTGPSKFEKRPKEGKKHVTSGGKHSRRLGWHKGSEVAARLFGDMWRPHWVGQKEHVLGG